MKVYTLKKTQKISKGIETVFDFFSKPENLSKITPEKMGFQIYTPSPIDMQEGTLIDYTIKIMGLPIRWTTLITKYGPPKIFIDQQIKGPYSMWHHKHTFKEINKSETIINDTVTYSLPFGFIGKIAHSIYVKNELNYIFSYREKKISQLLNS